MPSVGPEPGSLDRGRETQYDGNVEIAEKGGAVSKPSLEERITALERAVAEL